MIIKWDSEDRNNAFKSISEALDMAVDTVSTVATNRLYFDIERMARQELKTTYMPFIMGLSIVRKGDSIEFNLDDMAQQIETGFRARDLRSLLYGPSAKKNAKGEPYIDIPFRAATSRANMRGANFASQMERETYDAVRKMGSLRAADLDNTRGINKLTGYVHKNHIYAGLKKYDNPDGTGSVYFSFRRLSQNSDPDAFKIKAVAGRHIIKRAIESFDVQSVIKMING